MLYETCWQYPLVAVELVHCAPSLACELERGLHAEEQLGDVVLLILEVGLAMYDALVRLAVELDLVVDLHFSLGPLAGEVHELQLLYVQ